MATFDSIFPTFLAKCGELHTLLLSVAFALFIVGVIVTVMHHSSHDAILHLLLRLLLLTSLLVFLPAWFSAIPACSTQPAPPARQCSLST